MEQLGAGSRPEGVEALPQAALDFLKVRETHASSQVRLEFLG